MNKIEEIIAKCFKEQTNGMNVFYKNHNNNYEGEYTIDGTFNLKPLTTLIEDREKKAVEGFAGWYWDEMNKGTISNFVEQYFRKDTE